MNQNEKIAIIWNELPEASKIASQIPGAYVVQKSVEWTPVIPTEKREDRYS